MHKQSLKTRHLLKQLYRTFFTQLEEPIKYEVTKILPYNQKHFYQVVKNVDDYSNFIPWISHSKIIANTIQENFEPSGKQGRYDAETRIGFGAVNFSYISHVTYEDYSRIISEAHNSRIFKGLYSHWEIRAIDEDVSEVIYKIRMTFNNPLYSSVTNHFFDFLAKNINNAFEQRCFELYYKNRPIEKESKNIGGQRIVKTQVIPTETEHKQKVDQTKIKQINLEQKVVEKSRHLNDDSWVWDLHDQSQNQINASSAIKDKQKINPKKSLAVQQALKKMTWRGIIMDSIQDLKSNGYLLDIDKDQIQRGIESSEMLLWELKQLYEAFGQEEENMTVYARHMRKLILQFFQKE